MNRIHPILHSLARYFLGTVILLYAVSKIMGTQFFSSPDIWDKSVGELSGFELTWFYFGYSFWYGVFIASSQIIAALLLFFRKTTRLGIVLYLSIMINILVLDFAYSIDGAIKMAIALTIIAFYVFFLEYKAFFNFFINETPLYSEVDRPKWFNTLSKIKFIYIPVIVIGFFMLTNTMKKTVLTKNEFYGSWIPQNHKEWQRIYFEEASTFSIRGFDDFNELHKGKYEVDRDKKQIKFSQFTVDSFEVNEIIGANLDKIEFLFSVDYTLDDEMLQLKNDSITIRLKRLK